MRGAPKQRNVAATATAILKIENECTSTRQVLSGLGSRQDKAGRSEDSRELMAKIHTGPFSPLVSGK